MRMCEKNKKTIWVSNSKVETDLVDDDGNFTGETILDYETPSKIKLHLYPSTGAVVREIFGDVASLDMITTCIGTPFTKDSVFFLTEPTPPYSDTFDYFVSEIKTSLNQTSYGLNRRIGS